MIDIVKRNLKKLTKSKDVEEYRFTNTSCLIARDSRTNPDDEFKTAIIKLFDVNNPHKTSLLPKKTLEFPNTEKVRLRNLSVSYYIEGNDLIINDLLEIWIKVEHKKHRITIRAFQSAVEERISEIDIKRGY